MTRVLRCAPLSLIAAGVVAGPAAAQQVEARTAVLYERYTFRSGLPFDRVDELTVPVGLSVRLGRFGNLALSSGFARVTLASVDTSKLADQELQGALDTQVRLSWDAVPGRVVVLATGTLPTGMRTVELEELSILGAIASDVIGFATPNLGSGGNVGGGVVGAFPAGRFSLGLGATYREPLPYRPLADTTAELRPGRDVRVRGGMEGPLGRRTYLRAAVIYGVRAKDQVDGSPRNGVGNRLTGYVSVNQGVGRASVTLYGFDVFRSSPVIEETATGAALLPRGNVLGTGARVELPLTERVSVTPRAEFRLSSAAADTGSAPLRLAGEALRFGSDVRFAATDRLSVVLQGSGVSGFVVQGGSRIGFRGFRAGLMGEWRP